MRRLLPALLLIPLALPLPAAAQSAADVAGAAIGAAIEAIFTPEDRRTIEDYYKRQARKHKKDGLPPGLAKKDHLPPGLAKRDTLPPGLAKKALPSDLERRLSRLGKGRERAVVGDDIVLIETATGVILDILKGAAGGRH